MKAHAPATVRNREPILGVLSRVLPRRGTVLEIASGSGEHAVWFARELPGVVWQPSDASDEALASIEAWRAEGGSPNLRAPIRLDVTRAGWHGVVVAGASPADAPIAGVVCINMIHIAPWEACLGLMAGASALLGSGGLLVLYGPFRFGGTFTAPSNEAFDASLRARDPTWGVRDLDDVTAAALAQGLVRSEVVAMPANNHTVVFRRA